MGWLDTAMQLFGDIVDPFLPGDQGRTNKPVGTRAQINMLRAQQGLPPLRTRRKRALTKSDREDIAFIAGMLGKPAGKDFAMIVAGTR